MGVGSIQALCGWAIQRARSKLVQQGVFGTIRWASGQLVEVPSRHVRRMRGQRRELEYDRKHGVDTAGTISPARLALDSGMTVNGYAYQGCDPAIAVAAIGRLPIDCENFAFVDLGSGKGRSLICARQLGFRKYVGVEFSPMLCEVARRNNAALKTKDPTYPDWDIVCADAGTYKFSGPTVVWLFNPFGAEIMQRVIQHANRPDVFVIYFNPTLADLWEKDDVFLALHREPDYRIYQSNLTSSLPHLGQQHGALQAGA